ncbi:unnamed protein product [Ilex paraguariensis]|uniref:Uncharacterized protein n=1 Tax=Ilex paraguariensis TaxID=185542 RepID=A0ABC8SF99_9AQUA
MERFGAAIADPPDPSIEVNHAAPVKAGVSWLLERRATRQAGFTEQREPPAPCGGWITGRSTLTPTLPDGSTPIEPSPFGL